MHESRRDFLKLVGVAGTSGLAGLASPPAAAAEPPPETTRIRLYKTRSICIAPQYVAADLLRAEGFTDVQYIDFGPASGGLPSVLAQGAGEFDISMNFAAPTVMAIDQGAPVTLLAGIHPGCFEVFANERVRTVSDLKGKTVAVLGENSAQHIFLASIVTSVGLDPRKDVNWLWLPPEESKQRLAEGKIDAFLGFPPDAQELRARKVGRVVLDSAKDRPWSQYFCCMVVANSEFARKYPVATKRALRAIIKGAEICASDPERGARAFLDLGFKAPAEYARQAVSELPYGRWRDYNPEETVRFYALRLREAGMVKSSPQKIIASGTDWRLLDQLKRELKV